MIFKNKVVGLVVFCIGGGSKLLQSQLDGSKELPSIPAYPLKYFYPHWNEWKKKYQKLDSKLLLKLIIKHHAPILDSRLIPGNNGLRNLGKKRNKFIKISKTRFKYFFLKFLKDKKITSQNTLLAIHYAYFKSKKLKINKIKNFLYHIHEAEYFNKYLFKDFKNAKLIACCRDPINYFWKKIRLDRVIEKERFNETERIYFQQFDYVNSLDSIFIGFKNIPHKFFSKYHVIKFEDLKTKNVQTIKKLEKYLNIKISNKSLSPTFDGLTWWSDKSYEKKHKLAFDGTAYDYSKDFKFFFQYELFILKYVLVNFFIKANYKNLIIEKTFFKTILFFIAIILPTKYELKTLINFINPLNLYKYIKNCITESFVKNKLKNYYFNAMYKHKPQYASKIIINFNFFRKYIVKNENKKKYFIFVFFNRILNFIFKTITYLTIPVSFMLLYFERIYKLIFYYFKIQKVN